MSPQDERQALLDEFAGKAMQSLLVKPNEFNGVVGVNRFEPRLAESAYALAEAMLKEREHRQQLSRQQASRAQA